MTSEELARVLELVESARPTEPREEDRDCWFMEEGADGACDKIVEALKKEFGS